MISFFKNIRVKFGAKEPPVFKPKTMTTRENIIAIAKSQLGTKEAPASSNKTKYGEWYGQNGVSWCAIFVSWVYAQAGFPLGKIDTAKGYASCQNGYLHWKKTGEFTSNPQQGDIVLFDWNHDGHADHTGIFDHWEDATKTYFFSIEGNTSIADNSNGGEVMYRRRNRVSVKAWVSPKVLI